MLLLSFYHLVALLCCFLSSHIMISSFTLCSANMVLLRLSFSLLPWGAATGAVSSSIRGHHIMLWWWESDLTRNFAHAPVTLAHYSSWWMDRIDSRNMHKTKLAGDKEIQTYACIHLYIKYSHEHYTNSQSDMSTEKCYLANVHALSNFT
jgi:hypothetical protein